MSTEEPLHFADDTMERRQKALWKRLIRVHLVLGFFGLLALALVDPEMWQFFALGIAFMSAYACFTLLITRRGLMVPNVGCAECGALGFPADLKDGEGRCQRCGSEKMWAKGKRKFPRPDSWMPEPGDEPPKGLKNAIPATGVEILDGAVAVNDGFGARIGGD
ncbi:MAG: hypothetical protein NXI16_04570 [Alphaproteobacteria bacterium]|nr:hypothetical protein [Alphaproteobacteria bacterium]